MYKAFINPNSDKAKAIVNEFSNKVHVLRTEDNDQILFIETQNNKGERWYGSMNCNEVVVERIPNSPLNERDQRAYELWKQELKQEEKQRRLNHELLMAKHKKQRK